MSSPPQKVLVVGGGIGGLSACTGLRKYESADKVEIVLIEPKEYIEIFWAAYRSLFDAETAKGSLFSLEKFCVKNEVTLIQTTVTDLTASGVVTLENGQVLKDFDLFVLATGATTQWDGLGRDAAYRSMEERLEELKQEGQKLVDADTVVIVGGGLVGSEVAGDLAIYSRNACKSTRVILVHSGARLCHNEMNDTASALLKEKLEELCVKVILNDRLIENAEGKMILQSSREVLSADQYIMTTGNEPTNSFLDPQFLNDKGWVEVDEYFRVKGAEKKLFAIGDCCTLLPNQGWHLLQNRNTIGWNISAVLKAQRENQEEPSWLTKYSHSTELYICTIGPEDGVAYTPLCASDWFLPWFKNQTMFLFEPRWTLGLES